MLLESYWEYIHNVKNNQVQQELGAWIPSNMGSCPSLRHSEEKHMGEMILSNEQLVLRVQCGEDVAENMLQLWKQTKGFICKYAKKYSNYAEMEELEQEGYIALCNAIDGFKTEEGMSFIGYLSFYLKTQFARCINNNRSIPIPSSANEKYCKYLKIYGMFVRKYERKPTDKEMKSFLGVNDETYQSIKQSVYTENMKSLSSPVGGDVITDEPTLEEMIASEEHFEEDVERAIDHEAMKEELWRAVDSLESKERNIICMRYKEGMTQTQIGEIVGHHNSYVADVERKALRKLEHRKGKYKEYYKGYMQNYFRRVSVGKFNSTWSSATELEAIKNLSREEKMELIRKQRKEKQLNEQRSAILKALEAYKENPTDHNRESLATEIHIAEIMKLGELVNEFQEYLLPQNDLSKAI